jgi:hypothetical protein
MFTARKFLIAFVAFVALCAGFTEQVKAEPIVAINNTNILIRFDSATPGIVTTQAVTGLLAGEQLLGIDFRPANGLLYGLAAGSGIGNRLYTINALTGVATFASTLSTATNGVAGIDFNPVVDRLRVVTENEQNLRVNVDTGAVNVDSPLNPGDPQVTGAAYSNNSAGVSSTTLYVIDASTDMLFIQTPPNNGTLVAVGGLGVNTTNFIGFDISGLTGTAYAALVTSNRSGFYTINLTTGAATLVGNIGGPNDLFLVRGIAALPGAPIPEPTTLLLLGSGLVGVATGIRKRRKARDKEV